MTTLTLPLKAAYFHQIREGRKLKEYRLCTPYWAKRLVGRSYTRVVLTLGYQKLVLVWSNAEITGLSG